MNSFAMTILNIRNFTLLIFFGCKSIYKKAAVQHSFPKQQEPIIKNIAEELKINI